MKQYRVEIQDALGVFRSFNVFDFCANGAVGQICRVYPNCLVVRSEAWDDYKASVGRLILNAMTTPQPE